jgi:hypothetical protein
MKLVFDNDLYIRMEKAMKTSELKILSKEKLITVTGGMKLSIGTGLKAGQHRAPSTFLSLGDASEAPYGDIKSLVVKAWEG